MPKGNPNGSAGRKGDKLITDALRVAIKREAASPDKDGNRRSRIAAMAEAIAAEFEAGERWAVEFVTDRVEGKASQQLQHTGDGGGAIQVQQINQDATEFRRRIVGLAAGSAEGEGTGKPH